MLSAAEVVHRDTLLRVDDAIKNLKKSKESAVAEAEVNWKNAEALPEQYKTLKETMNSELDAVLDKITISRDNFDQETPGSLVEKGGIHTTADVKKAAAVSVRSIFKELLPEANKILDSFRKGSRNTANKTSRKSSSGNLDFASLPQPNQQFSTWYVAAPDKTVNIVALGKGEWPSKHAGSLPSPPALMDTICKCGFHAAAKWLLGQVEKDATLSFALAAMKPKTFKAITEAFKATGFADFMKMPPAPSDGNAVLEAAFQPQLFVGEEKHCHAGVTPHGVGEVRYVVSGNIVVAGMPLDSMPGNNLQEKIETVFTESGCRAFLRRCSNAVDKEGWLTALSQERSCIVIPPGQFVVTTGLRFPEAQAAQGTSFSGVRWGYLQADKNDVEQALKSVDFFLESFPQAGAEYGSMKKLLDMWKTVCV